MGSKRLKAVAARGTMSVALADREALDRQRADHIKSMQTPRPPLNVSQMERMHKYGTSSITYNSTHSGDSPVKNWGGAGIVDVPDRAPLHEDVVAKRVERLSGCWHCPIACKAAIGTARI